MESIRSRQRFLDYIIQNLDDIYAYIYILYIIATSNEWNSWQNYPWDESTKWWYFTTSQIPDPAAESALPTSGGKTVVLGCEINKKLWSSSKPPKKKKTKKHSPSNVFWRVYSFGQDPPKSHRTFDLFGSPEDDLNRCFVWYVHHLLDRWESFAETLSPKTRHFWWALDGSLGQQNVVMYDLLISVCIYIYNYYIKLNIDIIYICMYVACPKLFSAAQIF